MYEVPEKCPCEGCVCVPVCQHRIISDMVMHCKLLYDYLYDDNGMKIRPKKNYSIRIITIREFVPPTHFYTADQFK